MNAPIPWAAVLLALMLTGHAWAATTVVVGADPTKIVLKGTLVIPDQVIDGELVIDGDTITCAAVTCESLQSFPCRPPFGKGVGIDSP
jgi:hypothetical protein